MPYPCAAKRPYTTFPACLASYTDFVAEVNNDLLRAKFLDDDDVPTGTVLSMTIRAESLIHCFPVTLTSCSGAPRNRKMVSVQRARIGRARRRSFNRSAIDDNGNPTRRKIKRQTIATIFVSSARSSVSDPNVNRRRDRSAAVNSVENR